VQRAGGCRSAQPAVRSAAGRGVGRIVHMAFDPPPGLLSSRLLIALDSRSHGHGSARGAAPAAFLEAPDGLRHGRRLPHLDTRAAPPLCWLHPCRQGLWADSLGRYFVPCPQKPPVVDSGAVGAPAEATTLGRTAWELAARANQAHVPSPLSARELERWLISRGLAEPRNGGFIATDAGREPGEAIFG
jgi:hypothetical protein